MPVLSALDWVILGIVGFSALVSVIRGFVKEASSLLSWIIAFIVASIAKDTIKVLDIPAGKCNSISTNEMSRFLFYYCGELDSYPEIVHVPVENSLSVKCSVLNSEIEWVKENKN